MIVLALALFAWLLPAADLDQEVARSRQLLKDDKYEEALDAAAATADRFPDRAAPRAAMGDALYRRGDFDEAEASYKRALELNSEEASAHFGMGRILRTLGRYGEAAASFSRAAALSPETPKYLRVLANHLANRQDAIGMLKRYLVLVRERPDSPFNLFNPFDEEEAIVKNVEAWVALLERMGEEPISETVKGEPVSVPLQVLRGQAYLKLGVAGQKNLRFVFDTGATGFTISRRVAAKAKLVPIRPFTIAGTGAARLETGDLVVVPEISLGEAVVIRNVPATVRDASGPEEGLIGPSSFSGFDITVDLKGRRLTLDKPAAVAAPSGAVRPGHVEPFRNVGGEIVIAGRVNGRPLNAMVDTGSAATIVAKTALARVEGLVAVPAQWSAAPESGSIIGIGGALADRKAILKGTLSFAGRDYPAGGLVSSDLSGFSRSLEADIHVILGEPHLDDRAFTIDYRRMTVTFAEPPGAAPQR